ncbi:MULTISPECIES: ThuA domain-containing protein [unclassified Arenibacter]|uniref:ThuA domain-containing protein n=1 Tax=unclassified Arenibacter TaxID=2615047 RepID=UPI0015F2AAA8|nr:MULTISPECIES: ThuA domain-containing protein [unclassified Arenibacter]
MKNKTNQIAATIFLWALFLSSFQLMAQEHLDVDHQKKMNEHNAMGNGTALKVMLFSGTGWFRHPDIPIVNGWIVRLGAENNMQIDVSETGTDLSKEKLSNYDVLLFNNSNVLDKVLNGEQRNGIEEWYKAGGAIVGLHALLVHQDNWPWIMELGGCDFNSDSEFLKAKVVVDPEATDHPTVKGMGKEFWYEADWTNHTNTVTGLPGIQVLLRVDESTYEPVREYFKTRGGVPMGKDHPIAWTRDWGGGRFFYTELGHDIRSLDTDFGRQHLIEGIRWVAKKE